MKDLVLKTGVVGLALATLVASGTTTDTGISSISASILRDSTNKSATLKKVDSNYLKSDDGNLTLTLDGKAYDFTNADLVDNNSPTRYSKKFGDVTLSFEENISNNNFTVWSVGMYNSTADYTEFGWSVFGDKAQNVPTDKTSTFKGPMYGYSVIKADGVETRLDGQGQLFINYDASKIDGDFTFTKVYSPVTGDLKTLEFDKIVLVGGAITGNAVAGEIGLSKNDKFLSVTNSSFEGNFYGGDKNDLGIGGVGQAETDVSITTFGFGVFEQK